MTENKKEETEKPDEVTTREELGKALSEELEAAEDLVRRTERLLEEDSSEELVCGAEPSSEEQRLLLQISN